MSSTAAEMIEDLKCATQKKAVEIRFGLAGEPPLSYSETGKMLGMTETMARKSGEAGAGASPGPDEPVREFGQVCGLT